MIKVDQHKIGKGHPVYVIAEIGTNHNGNLELALETVKAAHKAGVDAVKFQIVTADRSYTKKSDSYAIFKKIELSFKEWKRIFKLARELHLNCFATFTNSEDLHDFAGLDCQVYKISSSNLTNFPLLRAIAKFKKPVILSTGLSYLHEVKEAVHYLEESGQKQIALLQCTSLYPTPFQYVNLNVIKELQKHFPKYPIGFSDHAVGITCAIGAVVLGARIVEKHFTLDKTLPGPDHQFSANPREMRLLVQAVREIEAALGSPIKEPAPAEKTFRQKWRRSLIAVEDIQVGEIFTRENLAIKRSPKKGLEPKYYGKVLGKKVKRFLSQDEPITKSHF